MSSQIQFLNRFSENVTNIKLYQSTAFPYATPHIRSNFQSATLSFRFRSILFDKKRALPFFLAVELLTQQKAIAVLARRHLLKWKVRKGSLVGCRVTLRNENLLTFRDTLEFYTPRIESAAVSSVLTRRQRRFDESIFHQNRVNKLSHEGRLNAAQFLKNLSKAKTGSSFESFTFSELTLFAPFEIGLGLHPDVNNFQFTLVFSSRPVEESFRIIARSKLPVKLVEHVCSSVG
jgi:hypothetical protein